MASARCRGTVESEPRGAGIAAEPVGLGCEKLACSTMMGNAFGLLGRETGPEGVGEAGPGED